MDSTQPTAASSYVYFIQHGDYGPVKIGIAVDPEKRRCELQTGNPEQLHVREQIPGGRELEGELHKRFAEWHIQGEWFGGGAWSAAILAFATGLREERENIEGSNFAGGGLEYIGRAIAPISTRERIDLRYDIERLWLRGFKAAEIADELNRYWGMSTEDIESEIKEMRKSTLYDVGKRKAGTSCRGANDWAVRKAA